MGGPKALIPWGPNGVPLSIAHASALRAAGAREVVLVLRDDVAEALAPQLGAPWLNVVRSHEPDALGPAGSLRAALKARPGAPTDLWVITPVDALPVRADVLEALRGAVGAGAAKPVFQGRGGHPVLVRRAHLAGFEAHGEPPTLRDALHALGEGLVRVEVLDARVTADLDTPEELGRWAERNR